MSGRYVRGASWLGLAFLAFTALRFLFGNGVLR